jgi:hypothetical protein
MASQEYIPGVCNINRAEVAYRRKAMYVGFGLVLVIFLALAFTGISGWLRAIIIFAPLFVGVIGYLQVKNSFCVSYGASGKQNAVDGGSVHEIAETEAKRADKRKARSMNLQALSVTLIVCVVSAFIPHF